MVRAARERANMSVGDVAAATRLRRAVIEGIERDDFTCIGGDVYARGHLRTIATLLNIDTAELIAEFDLTHAPAIESLEEMSRTYTGSRSLEMRIPWRRVSATAGLLALAALMWSVIPAFHPAASTKDVATIPQSVASPTPLPPQSSTDAPTTVVATKPQAVSVIVTSSRGSSWLAVTNSSGVQLFSSMLHRGESKEFTDAQQVYLTIGNAGGVDLNVNGKTLGAPGGNGQVVHLAFGPGSPTTG